MIKVYLDTNVLIGLKNEKSEEFRRLKQLIFDLRGRIYCFYSIAHLHDLRNDKTGQFDEELIFFESIVSDNFLVREWKQPNAEYLLYSPKIAHELYKEDSDIVSMLNFDGLELTEGLNEDEKKLLDSLKNQRLQFDILKNSGQSKESDDFLRQYFGELKDNYTVGELVKQFGSFYKSLFEDPHTYKNLRRSILEQMPLKQKWNVKMEDLDFNEKLENTPLAKSFMQFVKESMHNCKIRSN